jgi:hypothetical protein
MGLGIEQHMDHHHLGYDVHKSSHDTGHTFNSVTYHRTIQVQSVWACFPALWLYYCH